MAEYLVARSVSNVGFQAPAEFSSAEAAALEAASRWTNRAASSARDGDRIPYEFGGEIHTVTVTMAAGDQINVYVMPVAAAL